MSASVVSIRQNRVRFASMDPKLSENTPKPIREYIPSPQERHNIVRHFLFFRHSVTKLARTYRATEDAIQDVIRGEAYRIYPPTSAARRAA